MSRLPMITSDQLDDDQQRVWDVVTNGRRGPASQLIAPSGGLVGPFNASVHAPVTGLKVVELGEALRFDSSLDRRLMELAVCTVGAHWRANFEWWAHRRMAVEAGIDEAVLDAIEVGSEPELSADDERAVYRFTRSVLSSTRVDESLYEEVVGFVGETGVVELTQLIGYYCLVSVTLNVFEIPLPPDETPTWER